ncbi:MAG: GntR family transcriptional regulator [Calditrichaeota bacterium]|nr:MAG: GntR family transcriptional regulator [Calditrichota bacterium]MBL1205897.1 GntR family transcriptional regulator [Calditrichota bacterium]NOG45725.1 GntR family transcriptional regulator [Calditrichota bacterium]
MIELGKYNLLTAARETENGVYLEDQQGREVLLPNKYVTDDLKIGDEIDVFIFNDSEDRLTATTAKPKILLNEFAYLPVKEVTKFGAFLDWGLEKDLFVPFKEQPTKMVMGKKYVVYLYLDQQTDRLVASANFNRFLEKDDVFVEKGEKVDLLILDATELGVNVIINNMHRGLIFNNDIFQIIKTGDKVEGFIKNIRPDNKIDVTLQKPGFGNVEPNAQKILEKLQNNNGFLSLTDKSDPAEITAILEMSKKTFKKAVGTLYKKKLIRLEKDGIFLV